MSKASYPLNSSFQLPCGLSLKNRLVKSAMTERMSNKKLEPTENHHHLYELWAKTGAALLITGNLMVDPVHRESAGNVYAGDENMIPKLQDWATAAKNGDTQVWVQLSHAGRQTNKFLTLHPLAPSKVQLRKLGLFGRPKTMSEEEIEGVIQQFVKAALNCKAAGFTGIQIHAAHGYLLSQFLSPITNLRKDQWGGNLENRSRLLLRIVEECRQALGEEFPISVKLNSSDFQRGGFSEEDSLQVIQMLDGKIDLLEISGGTYEKLVFFEMNKDLDRVKDSTQQREAYFIEFSKKVRSLSKLPLLITGGFRSVDFCNQVLSNAELDFVGMARPFITNFNDIPAFLKNDIAKLENLVVRTGIKAIDDSAEGGYYARQLIRIAKGKNLDPKLRPISSSMFLILHEFRKAILRRMGS